MRQNLHRRHTRPDRRHLYIAHTGCRRADQHDLVAIFFRRDLAGQHVVKRIHRKGRPPLLVLVKICLHPQGRVSGDLLIAQLHACTQIDLYVFGLEIETLGRQH